MDLSLGVVKSVLELLGSPLIPICSLTYLVRDRNHAIGGPEECLRRRGLYAEVRRVPRSGVQHMGNTYHARLLPLYTSPRLVATPATSDPPHDSFPSHRLRSQQR